MKFKIVSFFIIIGFFFVGCEGNKDGNVNNTTTATISEKSIKENGKVTRNPTEVTLKSVKGEEIRVKKINSREFDFDDYEGKVVLLNFFATWCRPCRAEVPHLVDLQKRYKDKDFQIISILLEDIGKDGLPIEELKAFIEENEINYIITIGREENSLMERFAGGTGSIPFMVLYDKEGKYVTQYRGSVPEEMIETDIKKVLNR